MTTRQRPPLASELLANITPPPSEADIVMMCESCSIERRLSGVIVGRTGDGTTYQCPKDHTLLMSVVPDTESDWVIQAPNDWWVEPRGPLT